MANTLYIWDDVGAWAYSRNGATVGELALRLGADRQWEREAKFNFGLNRPRRVFTGSLTVNGRAPLDAIPGDELRSAYAFLEVGTGPWNIAFSLMTQVQTPIAAMEMRDRLAKIDTGEIASLVREAAAPFRDVAISFNPPAAPSGKWDMPPHSGEPVLAFASLPFKLAVMQELMYRQQVLAPQFDVYDFARDQGEGNFDPNEIGYDIIALVQVWFERLPIPAGLADQVERLYLDGGNDVYLQLSPQWDGEDGRFDIDLLTAGELAPFTNLREIDDTGGFLSPRARESLEDRGVRLV